MQLLFVIDVQSLEFAFPLLLTFELTSMFQKMETMFQLL